MKDYLWAYPVGRIRFIEKTLLSKGDLARVLEAPTLETAQSALRDSYYGPYMSKLDNVQDFEPALESAMKDVYEGVLGIAPEPLIIDAYRARYDFHNLKVLLKAELLDVEPDKNAFSALGNFDVDKLVGLIEEVRTEDIDAKSRGEKRFQTDDPREKSLYGIELEIKTVYKDIVSKSAEIPLAPFDVDSYIDRSYYSWISAVYRKHGYYYLIQFIQREIDIINMKMMIRGRRLDISPDRIEGALLPGGTIKVDVLLSGYSGELEDIYTLYMGSELQDLALRALRHLEKNEPLTHWEKECDDAVASVMREAGKVSLGPEPVFGYVFGREIEAKNLRIIFSGKQSSVPEPRIRERLREGYA